MLTKRKIKKFCVHTIGIFVVNAEQDIIVEKHRGIYEVILQNLRAPEHIIKDTWNRHSEGTKFEQIYLNVNGLWRY